MIQGFVLDRHYKVIKQGNGSNYPVGSIVKCVRLSENVENRYAGCEVIIPAPGVDSDNNVVGYRGNWLYKEDAEPYKLLSTPTKFKRIYKSSKTQKGVFLLNELEGGFTYLPNWQRIKLEALANEIGMDIYIISGTYNECEIGKLYSKAYLIFVNPHKYQGRKLSDGERFRGGGVFSTRKDAFVFLDIFHSRRLYDSRKKHLFISLINNILASRESVSYYDILGTQTSKEIPNVFSLIFSKNEEIVKKRISEKDSEINTLAGQLNDTIKEKQTLIKQLFIVQELCKKDNSVLQREINSLSKHKMLSSSSLEYSKSEIKITMTTHPLFLVLNSGNLPIGKATFIITYKGQDDLYIKVHTYLCPHPHNSTSPCFGGFGNKIGELYHSVKLKELFEVLLSWISSYNPGSILTRNIYSLLSDKGILINEDDYLALPESEAEELVFE